MQSLNSKEIKTSVVKEKYENTGIGFSQTSLDLILPYNKDPFLGHFITPISASKIVKSYLKSLPAYKTQMPPLLRGINFGFAHGYILFGPFANLGPLRESHAANFIGFLAAVSIIILLTFGILSYGYLSFKRQKFENKNDKNLNFLNKAGWYQMGAGFTLGGIGGSGVAYILANYIAAKFSII